MFLRKEIMSCMSMTLKFNDPCKKQGQRLSSLSSSYMAWLSLCGSSVFTDTLHEFDTVTNDASEGFYITLDIVGT